MAARHIATALAAIGLDFSPWVFKGNPSVLGIASGRRCWRFGAHRASDLSVHSAVSRRGRRSRLFFAATS